jgi:elongation factor P--beta-lysine ligase
MQNKIDPVKLLKEDEELWLLVQDSMRTKKKHCVWLLEIQEEFFTLNRYFKSPESKRHLYAKVFTILEWGKLLARKRRDVKRLSYLLDSASGNVVNDWDIAYRKATESVTIEEVIKMYFSEDLNLKRNIVCPFHEDDSPSFKVYERSNSFHCFGCGVNGKPVNFVMLKEGLNFKEAVWRLSNF